MKTEDEIMEILENSSFKFMIGDAGKLAGISRQRPDAPFSDRTIDFLNDISAALRRSPGFRSMPDVAAFAFWCRRANLNLMKSRYTDPGERRLGRGVTVHFAPSNIPVLFAFTMAAGLLSGCMTIVRLGRQDYAQQRLICSVVNELLENEYQDFAPRLILCRYGHEREITDYLSSISDVRVLWGSDESVNNIRLSPLPPRGIDIPFAARSSAAVFSARAVLGSDRLDVLAKAFYNDTYLNDQNACSSPRIICWIGDAGTVKAAQDRFWNEIAVLVSARGYDVGAELAVRKLDASLLLAAGYQAQSIERPDNSLFRVQVPQLTPQLWDHTVPGGFFIECGGKDMEYIVPILDGYCQTICTIGIEPEDIARLAQENRVRGVDRIVPVGHTLDFALTWDGFDLPRTMSRVINYRE